MRLFVTWVEIFIFSKMWEMIKNITWLKNQNVTFHKVWNNFHKYSWKRQIDREPWTSYWHELSNFFEARGSTYRVFFFEFDRRPFHPTQNKMSHSSSIELKFSMKTGQVLPSMCAIFSIIWSFLNKANFFEYPIVTILQPELPSNWLFQNSEIQLKSWSDTK